MGLLNRIEELEKELLELKGQVKEQEFPQDGDEYWLINGDCSFQVIKWNCDSFDKRANEIGNTYKTKGEAEFAVEKFKVEAELRKYGRPFVWGRENWYLGMDNDKDIFLEYDNYEMYHGVTYFESKNKVKEAIEAVGEERIKKYIFRVED